MAAAAAASPPHKTRPGRRRKSLTGILRPWAQARGPTGRTDLVQRLQPLFAGAPAICACEGNTDLESMVLNPTVQFLLRGKRSTECLLCA